MSVMEMATVLIWMPQKNISADFIETWWYEWAYQREEPTNFC